MIRNGFFLPSLKSTIITEDYMVKVRSGAVWCPKFSEIRLGPCVSPPKLEYLMNEVVRLSTEKGLDIGATPKNMPDRKWLLNVLSTMDPDHEVFKKSYMPPAPVPRRENKVVDNSDSFFDQLPMLTNKRDMKATSKLRSYQVHKQ